MKKLFGAMAVCAATVAPAAAEGPVVVELYTSQGCSSCPPADEILAKLAKKPGVIALALHVDYWDYIGWKDAFAKPEHTKRQKAYAREAGARTIYTPQMVIGGVDHVVGARPMDVLDLLGTHKARPAVMTLTAHRDGSMVEIEGTPPQPAQGALLVQLVRYLPEESVAIKRGENAGLTMSYANIVRDWQVLAEWDGSAALDMRVEAPGEAPAVVIVQKAGPGAIVAAARVD
ncbi:MAG: DUF1223 domain-containing protein [Vannielia sp.]|uniref:DUF1223 domain-containing protein n=1 Tax=Rhodobacterales TaxID=204455 RepID=UPI002095AA72|nr:DUF1223 domain-containing protein [Oceanicola sp. 502str15]MCO6382266.1 DUF1223 domain-containing protein [Oceanicola sp. 502str15]